MSGRVEIFHPMFGWGTVCDNSWRITDSNVVCRQLGFTGAIATRNAAYYGEGSGSISLVNVRCNGIESNIWNCPHNGWNKHPCTHKEDAGVDCITCKKGYTFDGIGCVGMYVLTFQITSLRLPLQIYQNIVSLFHNGAFRIIHLFLFSRTFPN